MGFVSRLHSNKRISAQHSSVNGWLGMNGIKLTICYHASVYKSEEFGEFGEFNRTSRYNSLPRKTFKGR